MRLMSVVMALAFALNGFAAPVVTDITAKQRFPWNGLVDITVTLSGMKEECKSSAWEFYATNKATNAAMPVASVNEVGTATGEGSQWTRRFVWNATEDLGKAKFGEVVLSVSPWKPSATGVQLWKNGPYWAECNVGATMPEECGFYFWWGDTVGYKRNASDNGWVSVKDGSSFSFYSGNCPTHGKSNSQLQSEGYIDLTGNLVAAYDAATAHLGAPWRMPTDAEFSALISNCETMWTTRNGVYGRLVKGKGNYSSKSIFLPAAGRGRGVYLRSLGALGNYRSSTPHSDDSYYAWDLDFYSSYFGWNDSDSNRDEGQSVRPVRGFAK